MATYRDAQDEIATLRQEMAAEQERLAKVEAAAIRVVQLVDHGADSLAVGGAIAELRRVLDGWQKAPSAQGVERHPLRPNGIGSPDRGTVST